MVEINELKRSKEQLVGLLDDKSEELEALRKARTRSEAISPSKSEAFEPKITITATIPGSHHHHHNIPVVTEDDYLDLVRKLQSTFDLKDDNLLKRTVVDYFRKRHLSTSTASESTEVSESDDKSNKDVYENGIDSLRSEVSKYKKDLQSEKDRSRKLQGEMDQLYKDYENIVRNSTPNYDDLKKKIVQETVSRERSKYDKERQIILADLQHRVDKVVKLEIELDEEREKNRAIEDRMSEGERGLKKKVVTLENNLEQLTNMYHQLASQKSIWKVDNQVRD